MQFQFRNEKVTFSRNPFVMLGGAVSHSSIEADGILSRPKMRKLTLIQTQ